MQVYWRRHLFVLALMAGTWLLAWIIDYFFLGPRSGGWISINLRGFLVGPYVAVSLVFAIASTTLIAVLKPARLPTAAKIYVTTLAGVLVIFVLVVRLWSESGEGNLEDDYARITIDARRLASVIELQEWQHKDGRVDILLEILEPVASVQVKVQAVDAEGSVAAEGSKSAGRLEPGRTTVSVQVQEFGKGQEWQWRIRLLLDNDEAIANLEFATHPVASDGALIGRRLPPPLSD